MTNQYKIGNLETTSRTGHAKNMKGPVTVKAAFPQGTPPCTTSESSSRERNQHLDIHRSCKSIYNQIWENIRDWFSESDSTVPTSGKYLKRKAGHSCDEARLSQQESILYQSDKNTDRESCKRDLGFKSN